MNLGTLRHPATAGAYRDAYMSLSAAAVFAPFVRLELLHWDPIFTGQAGKGQVPRLHLRRLLCKNATNCDFVYYSASSAPQHRAHLSSCTVLLLSMDCIFWRHLGTPGTLESHKIVPRVGTVALPAWHVHKQARLAWKGSQLHLKPACRL